MIGGQIGLMKSPQSKSAEVRRRPMGFLKAWRTERKLSQTELGARAGYSQGQISQWEGGTSGFDMENVEDMAFVLNISTKQLLYRDPKQPESIEDIHDALPSDEQQRLLAIAKALRPVSKG